VSDEVEAVPTNGVPPNAGLQEPVGSPPLAGFADARVLLAVAVDPAGCAARLEALEKATQAAAAREARALKAQAKLEEDRAAWAAEVSAERAKFSQEKARFAKIYSELQYDKECWAEFCGSDSEEYYAWLRRGDRENPPIGVALGDPAALQQFHSRQAREAAARNLPARFTASSAEMADVAQPASPIMRHNAPIRRGGRRIDGGPPAS
jgi:hypothetical protein